jgi:hypothetical protein|tara:strand:+ start:547 stop:807 length:261 start_codon:yes stop_codon:yes gene_type:complete
MQPPTVLRWLWTRFAFFAAKRKCTALAVSATIGITMSDFWWQKAQEEEQQQWEKWNEEMEELIKWLEKDPIFNKNYKETENDNRQN